VVSFTPRQLYLQGKSPWNAVGRRLAMTNAYGILVGEMERKRHSEHPDVDGRIILECALGKYGEGMWTGFI
jgi:hypothetical protein